MAPTFRYSHPTTPAGTGFDTDLGQVVPWGSITGLVTMAKGAEVGQSTINIDDPDGIYDIKGLHRFRMVESEATTDPVWNGYIANQTIGRIGASERFLTGDARSWELSLTDDNAILGFRVVWDTDGNRAAESGSARLAWLISTNYLGDVVDDGYVTYPGTAYTMDATDYRGQYGRDVLLDIALQCGGVNTFAQYNLSTSGTSQSIGLWFGDSNMSTAFTSSVIIDNRAGSSDGTAVFAPSDDTVLVRDPSRIAAGVYVPFSGGAVYAYDYDTSYAYAFRDQVAPTATISSTAQATALADRFLADFNEPEERVTTTIWMKPANLYDVRAGHRLQAYFQHLPGYEAGRWMRVTQKTIGNFETSLGRYEVGLELSPVELTETMGLALVTQHNTYQEPGSGTWIIDAPDGAVSIAQFNVLALDPVYYGVKGPNPYVGLGINLHDVTAGAAVSWAADGSGFIGNNCWHRLSVYNTTGVLGTATRLSYGTTVEIPAITVADPALLVACVLVKTSASPANDPSGWTQIHDVSAALGDRARCAIFYKSVSAGTTAAQTFTSGVEGNNTAGVLVVAFGGSNASIALVDTTGIISSTTGVDLP